VEFLANAKGNASNITNNRIPMKPPFQAASRPNASAAPLATFASSPLHSSPHFVPHVVPHVVSHVVPETPLHNDIAFFAEPCDSRVDAEREARAQAMEAITRFLIWIAEGSSPQQRGLRATVALYCVRPDLIKSPSLSQIGEWGGVTEQATHKLAKQFRAAVNLKPSA
jgi:hypothetical protein